MSEAGLYFDTATRVGLEEVGEAWRTRSRISDRDSESSWRRSCGTFEIAVEVMRGRATVENALRMLLADFIGDPLVEAKPVPT